jgi:hypothetical protein
MHSDALVKRFHRVAERTVNLGRSLQPSSKHKIASMVGHEPPVVSK